MELLRQVYHDIRKEIGWILFFTVILVAVVFSLAFILNRLQDVWEKHGFIREFIKNDVQFVSTTETKLNNPSASLHVPELAPVKSLPDFLDEGFRANGSLGTYAIMRGALDHTQVIIVLGAYVDLLGVELGPSNDMYVAVTNDLANEKADSITLQGTEYPIGVLPPDFGLFHPYRYDSARSGQIDDSLFIFSKNYRQIRALFPANTYWDMSDEFFLYNLLLSQPTPEDIVELRQVMEASGKGHTMLMSMRAFTEDLTAGSDLYNHLAMLWFCVVASFALFFVICVTSIRMLRRKFSEYAIHKLFGTTNGFLFGRMFLFAFVYLGIPLAGAIWLLSYRTHRTLPNGDIYTNYLLIKNDSTIFILGIVALAFIVFVTVSMHRSFRAAYAKGRRRD
jgi:cell division protein FtsX